MKRTELIQEIYLISEKKKLNKSTMVFLLAMSTDKEVKRIYKQLKDFEEGDKLVFTKKYKFSHCDLEIIPNSEYTVVIDKRKKYKGWINLAGLFNTKNTTVPTGVGVNPEQLKELKLLIK